MTTLEIPATFVDLIWFLGIGFLVVEAMARIRNKFLALIVSAVLVFGAFVANGMITVILPGNVVDVSELTADLLADFQPAEATYRQEPQDASLEVQEANTNTDPNTDLLDDPRFVCYPTEKAPQRLQPEPTLGPVTGNVTVIPLTPQVPTTLSPTATPLTPVMTRVALEMTPQPSATVTPTPTSTPTLTPTPETAAIVASPTITPMQSKSALGTNLLWALAAVALTLLAIAVIYLMTHPHLEVRMKSAVLSVPLKLHLEAMAVLATGAALLSAVYNSPKMAHFVVTSGVYQFPPFANLGNIPAEWMARTSTPSPELRFVMIALLTVVIVVLALSFIYRQPRLNRVAAS